MSTYARIISITTFGLLGYVNVEAQDEVAAAQDEVNLAVTAVGEAYSANDLDRYISFFADDAVIVDGEGRELSPEDIHAEWTSLLNSGGEVSEYDANHPRSIRLSPDLKTAVVYYPSVPISYRYPDDSKTDGFVFDTSLYAITDVWMKIEGSWKTVHQHYHELPSKGGNE